MNTPFVGGNWKMNLNFHEALEIFTQIHAMTSEFSKKTEVVIFPPSLYIDSLATFVSEMNSSLLLGGQNISNNVNGSFTGEISAEMLSQFCDYTILGHSERRNFYYETDSTIAERCIRAHSIGLNTILCVGEPLEVYDSGKSTEYIDNQLSSILTKAQKINASSLIVAYEPLWAVGTGIPASTHYLQQITFQIRRILSDIFGETFSNDIRVIYGGSVSVDNVSEIVSIPAIDGVLVGSNSLNAKLFSEIVKIVNKQNDSDVLV